MAVEEKVRENIPQAEGEAQGVRYISLTEEELDRLMKAAGREGAVSYTHLTLPTNSRV